MANLKQIIPSLTGSAIILSLSLFAGSDIPKLRQAPRSISTRDVTLPQNSVTLCGALVYSDLWGEMQDDEYVNPITAGIYNIDASESGENTLVKQVSSMSKIRAAVKVSNTFYTFQYLTGEDSYDYVGFVSYSASTWSQSSSKEVSNTNLPSDLTYDPVTEKVYGFFYNSDEDYYCKFGSLNLSSGTVTTISLNNTDVRDGSAIAANANGEIYAIWSAIGYLMKIDPVAKTMERVGRTGVYPGDPARGAVSSMAFDDVSGKLYWACTDENNKSGLYEVNTSTGAATLIRNFENNEAFAGLFALSYSTPTEAPAAPSDVAVEFSTPGATTGKISFTAPSLTVGGEALSENLNVGVSLNGSEFVIENVVPGSIAYSSSLSFVEGENSIEVVACTESLRGESAAITAWAGLDAPGSPTNVSLSEIDGAPFISWQAPTIGKNGGYFNPADIKYNVTRFPDNVAVASNISETEFTDNSLSKTSAIYYEVTALNEKGESLPAQSEKLVIGDGFKIPFSEGFDTEDDFNLWTIIDLNGGSTWEYDSSKQYIKSKYTTPDTATDDWFISPKIKMEEGKVYALKFDSKVLYRSYPENFSFYLGTAPDAEAMTTKLVEKTDYLVTSFESNRVVFNSPGSGYYYLGLYTNSIPHHWELDIDNIGIEEVDSRVPGKVENLSVTPGEKGALSAQLTFTMPQKDSKGNDISESLTANIYRNGSSEPVATVDGLAPGAQAEWSDTGITTSALTSYRVSASTEAGEGEAAEAAAFIGVDAPGAVNNLRAVESTSGVTLSWEAPTVGANGGYFDPDNITYRIVRSSDATVLTQDCTELSFVDNSLSLNSQELLYYLVTPYSGSVKGTYATTPMHQVFGPAYSAPFSESFPNADMKYYPWVSESDGSQYVWSLDGAGTNPVTSDQNGDGGLATFISTSATVGITGSFYSPKVDISNCVDPELSFWFYHSAAKSDDLNEALEVLISTNGVDFATLSDKMILRDNGFAGWQRHSFSLADFKSAQSVRILFRAKALGGANFYIDNVKIDNSVGNDVEISSLSAPSKAATGVEVNFIAKISNNGAQDIPQINVSLSADNEVINSVSVENLIAGSSKDIAIPASFVSTGEKNVTIRAEFASDSNLDNNTASRTITITDPVLPRVEDVEAQTYNNEVNLKWDSPLKHGAVTDDIESYTDWAIDNIGDWTMIDRDYDVTYRINYNLDSYPNENSAKSFQVCNASTLGINIWDEGTPHSGIKMLMSMASVNTTNSDWMVSPLLNGSAQTISFWAKSFTIDDDIKAERMRVYYSSTDPLPESMTKISEGNYLDVPDQWTEYAYQLPQGAKYFALECVSDDSFALFIDDLKFNDLTVPVTEVDHYEIYRGGVKLAETSDDSYTDTEKIVDVARNYVIRTLFTNGMQSDSDTISVTISGVDEITTESAPIDIFSPDGLIIKRNASTQDIKELPSGIYILRSNNISTKFVK